MKARTRLLQLCAVAVVLALPAVLGAQQAVAKSPGIHQTNDAVYASIDKPNSTYTCALGISPNGRIVGVYKTHENPLPGALAYEPATGFLLEGFTFTDIAYQPFFGSVPSGGINATFPVKINAQGTIVGWWANQPQPASNEIGWVLEKGRFSVIRYDGAVPAEDPPIPANTPVITDLVSINSSGDLVGQLMYLKDETHPENNVVHGWFYDSNKYQFHLFDPPGSVLTFPGDMNDKGDIVGGYYRLRVDGEPEIVGFLMKKDGSFEDILVPAEWGAEAQWANGINSGGVVVGQYMVGPVPHGYTLNQGVFTQIDPPGAAGSWPMGINPAGVIVGCYGVLDNGMPRVHGYVRIPKGRL